MISQKLSEIEIDGRKIKYEIFYDVSEYGEIYETIFYEGTEIKKYKKYFLFGPIITKEIPKQIFKLYYNIEDESMTKSDIKSAICRKLELLGRKSEIERGEII